MKGNKPQTILEGGDMSLEMCIVNVVRNAVREIERESIKLTFRIKLNLIWKILKTKGVSKHYTIKELIGDEY